MSWSRPARQLELEGRGGAGEIPFVVTPPPPLTPQAAGVSVWAPAGPWWCFSISLFLNAHSWTFHTCRLSGRGPTRGPIVRPCLGFLCVSFTFHLPG